MDKICCYIKGLNKYPRGIASIFIVLIMGLLISFMDNSSVIVAALIALIAAMMAHHSVFARIDAQKKKDDELSQKMIDNVILRAKLLSTEFLSYIDHRKSDINDNLSFFRDKVSLNVILQYTVKLPSDFNYVLENIEKINSLKVMDAIAKILYLSGQINHHVEIVRKSVEINMEYIERIKPELAKKYNMDVPIKDLEMIDFWLTLLQKAVKNMYDGMKEIKPINAIYTDNSTSNSG